MEPKNPNEVTNEEFLANSEKLRAGVPLVELEEVVEPETDDQPEEPSKTPTPKKTPSKASAKKGAAKKTPKERKPLTLHKHWLIDIRRYKAYLDAGEDKFGSELAIKKTKIKVDGKKYNAITIAVLDS